MTALVNSNGTLVGRYWYDPFGITIAVAGAAAEANFYRFSGKEWHEQSGLVYYLYRYYAPSLQRWVNRDPLEEEGGINLHRFSLNSPVTYFDAFGQNPLSELLSAILAEDTAQIELILDAWGEDLGTATVQWAKQKLADIVKKKACEAAKILARKIKAAEKLFRTNKKFKDWVHRVFKPKAPKDGGNRDLTPEELVEAMEEYLNL